MVNDKSVYQFWHLTWRKFKKRRWYCYRKFLPSHSIFCVIWEFTSIKMRNKSRRETQNNLILVLSHTQPLWANCKNKQKLSSLTDKLPQIFCLMSFKNVNILGFLNCELVPLWYISEEISYYLKPKIIVFL